MLRNIEVDWISVPGEFFWVDSSALRYRKPSGAAISKPDCPLPLKTEAIQQASEGHATDVTLVSRDPLGTKSQLAYLLSDGNYSETTLR